MLLGVAAVYPRLRPGLRATLIALLGLFGIVAGIEAAYYAKSGQLSGDDYTGLAAIPAGALLLAVAAVTLWRTRRVDDDVRWRFLRRVLIAAASVVGAYLFLAP